jgi:hypothetical protein
MRDHFRSWEVRLLLASDDYFLCVRLPNQDQQTNQRNRDLPGHEKRRLKQTRRAWQALLKEKDEKRTS